MSLLLAPLPRRPERRLCLIQTINQTAACRRPRSDLVPAPAILRYVVHSTDAADYVALVDYVVIVRRAVAIRPDNGSERENGHLKPALNPKQRYAGHAPKASESPWRAARLLGALPASIRGRFAARK